MRRILALLMVAIPLVVIITACGSSLDAPRNGTYRQEGLLSQTWTFSGTNDISMSTAGGLINANGTWSIDGDRLTVTITMLGSQTSSIYTITDITRNSFYIDGARFVRQ